MSKLQTDVNIILSKLKSGDQSMFQVLYDKTYEQLKVLSLKYAIDKNDIEDILIEAFFRVFKYIKTIDFSKDGYNWLCKIVQNVAYDFNSRFNYTLSLETSYPLDDNTLIRLFGNFEEQLLNIDMIKQELEKLSEYDKKLLKLKFWNDMTYSQIAIIVNSKRSTVHKKISDIIEKIKLNMFEFQS